MKSACVGMFLLLVILSSRISAQDSNAGAASSSPPAAAPAVQPALTNTAPTIEGKKPKKVWTNDEIKSVKGNVSVVGDSNFSSDASEAKKPPTASGQKDLHQQQLDNYRKQIQDLRRQIDAADQRISQLKNFKGENTAPAGGINPAQGYNMVPLEEQVKQLEEKKKQLGAKIEDMENDARKNGISPGELR